MRLFALVWSTTSLVALSAAASEGSRELGAHEHGTGVLNIAVEDGVIAMELEAPGADIVGFEYTAESEADRAAVDKAISDLARPLDWFVVPAEAECKVLEASVALIGEEDHDDHDHEEEHAHDEHDHDEHEDQASDDHGHDEHDHEEHAKDEHGHDDEAGAQHTEFHAEYTLDCGTPDAIDTIEFVYFERFPSAQELDVQIVSDTGAQAFEVERDDPVLDMRELF